MDGLLPFVVVCGGGLLRFLLRLLFGLLNLLLLALLLRCLLSLLLLLLLLRLLSGRLRLLLLLLDLRDHLLVVVIVIAATADQGQPGGADAGSARGAQEGAAGSLAAVAFAPLPLRSSPRWRLRDPNQCVNAANSVWNAVEAPSWLPVPRSRDRRCDSPAGGRAAILTNASTHEGCPYRVVGRRGC